MEEKDERKAIGGHARAKSLSPEKRQEIARQAAEKRWGKSIPTAEYNGVLQIAGMEFPCAVLSDGTRVLTEMDFMKVMGIYRSGALSTRRQESNDSGARIPLYLAFKNLKPFIDRHLGSVHVQPLVFRTLTGSIAHGITAGIIPKVCEVWLDARRERRLGKRQEEIAAKAEILVRGLAHVGIVALVDEATGYQRDRARNALAKILEDFIAKELRPWVQTFPDNFYEQVFRLRGLQYPEDKIKRPQYFGHLTNDIVYKRLAPGILAELKKITPRSQNGSRKHHYHRRLTEDVGHPKLREHLASVVTLMKLSDNYKQFEKLLNRIHPRYGDTLELFVEDDGIGL